MGASKTDHFSVEQNQMAGIAKALGHPARIAILEYLSQVENCICGDIVDELPLAQPTVSQHLKELKNAGIIQGNIEGNAICYCIDPQILKNFRDYVNKLSKSGKRNKPCC